MAEDDIKVIDSDALLLGDIILERGDDKAAGAIATATGGQFSHALIYVGGDDVVEAMPGGVRSLSLHRLPVTEKSVLKLLRVEAAHKSIAAKAAEHARGETFKQYDMRGALTSQSAPRKTPLNSALFCSQLVAKSYAQAGLDLAPGYTLSSISPNHLERSPMLQSRSLPLKPAPKALLPLLASALKDRSAAYKTSTMAQEMEVARKAYELAMGAIAKTGFRFHAAFSPGNLHELLDVLNNMPEPARTVGADHLYEALDQGGYFMIGLSMLYQILHSDAAPAQISYEDARKRNLDNARACIERSKAFDHRLWRRLGAMHGFMAEGMVALTERAAAARRTKT